MTITATLVPDGISHTPDLSGLPPDERKNHHIKQLRSAMFQSAKKAAADYRRDHPEAGDLLTLIDTKAFQPKPPGYYPAWRKLVGLWLTDEAALARPQGHDVDYLNAELGGARFDRNRYLSKPVNGSERKQAAELFEAKGLILPDTVRSRADVKREAKVRKANARPGAMPFGSIGTRSEDTLTVGGRSFRVQRGQGQEFIRPTINGTRRRLYLDEVSWLADLLIGAVGEPRGTPLSLYVIQLGKWPSCPDRARWTPWQIPWKQVPPGKWPPPPASPNAYLGYPPRSPPNSLPPSQPTWTRWSCELRRASPLITRTTK